MSVDVFDGKHLPYTDNLVNLVVVDSASDVPWDECRRDGEWLDPGTEDLFEQALAEWKKLVRDPLSLLNDRKRHSRLPELKAQAVTVVFAAGHFLIERERWAEAEAQADVGAVVLHGRPGREP